MKEQGQASSVRGEAVVRVNFDASGNVIVGVNTPRIVEDSVPPMYETKRYVSSRRVGALLTNVDKSCP